VLSAPDRDALCLRAAWTFESARRPIRSALASAEWQIGVDCVGSASYPWCVTLDEIAEQIWSAFASKDLDAFAALLADDVRWGDDDNPNKCRSRSEVVTTFARLLGEGVDGQVTETIVGVNGIAVCLHVRWPNPGEGRSVDLYQDYLVTDGRVTEIQRYDDRRSAISALSH